MTSFTAAHGATAGVQFERPDAAAWAAKLDLQRKGDNWVGPCPVCGTGRDRFHVVDADGRSGMAGCRHCDDTDPAWYRDALAAAGFEVTTNGNGYRPRVCRPRVVNPAPKPVMKHKRHIVDLARRLVDSACPVPAHVQQGWRTGLLLAAAPSDLAWIGADEALHLRASVPASAMGALVAPLGRPVAACQLLYVDSDYAKIGDPDKRTYGPAGGRGFVVGDGDVLRVCEGVADALALSTLGGTVAAAVGSGGIGRLAMAALNAMPSRFSRIVMVPDGEDENAIEKARDALGKLGELAVHTGSRCAFAVDDSWCPDPAAAWERR